MHVFRNVTVGLVCPFSDIRPRYDLKMEGAESGDGEEFMPEVVISVPKVELPNMGLQNALLGYQARFGIGKTHFGIRLCMVTL